MTEQLSDSEAARNNAEAFFRAQRAVAELREASRDPIAERHPDWPRIHVTVDLASHESESDQAGSEDRIRRAQIVLNEGASSVGRDAAMARMNELSAADSSDLSDDDVDLIVSQERDSLGDPVQGALKKFRKMIYGSGAVVSTIDIGEEDQIPVHELLSLYNEDFDPEAETMTEMLTSYDKKMKRASELQAEREKLMAGRLEERIGLILAAHPELLQRSDLDIVILMGADHVVLSERIKAAGFGDVKVAQRWPDTRAMGQVMEAHMQGREATDEQLARCFWEHMIVSALSSHVPQGGTETNNDDMHEYARRAAAEFSNEEIEERVWRTYHRNRGTYTAGMVERVLAGRGLPALPRSAAEIRERLGRT